MKCTYIKPDGKQCNANAIRNSEYCFSHNPDYTRAKALAVKEGGLNRKHCQTYGKALKLETSKDIKRLLGKVINGVWTGKMPANQPANTIGFLSRCFLDAHEASEVESRLQTLEERLERAGL